MRAVVRLDPVGLRQIARSSGMQDAIDEAGEAVADNVRSMRIRVQHIPGDIDLPVTNEPGSLDDQAASFVTLAHPSGEAVQAKHGALSKAAAQAGLDFRSS